MAVRRVADSDPARCPEFSVFHAIALLSPPYATLTYETPAWLPGFCWRPGLRVVMPLGRGMLRTGVVLDEGRQTSDLAATVTVRPLLWPLEREPLLPAGHLLMARELALRQMVTPGQILAAMLPAGLRQSTLKLRVFAEKSRARSVPLREVARLPEAERLALGQGWLAGDVELLAPTDDAAASELCVLLRDPPWPVRPGALRQTAILEQLYEHGVMSRRDVLKTCGSGSAPALDALLRNDLVALRRNGEEEPEDNAPWVAPASTPAFALSAPQQAALEGFCAALDAQKAASQLLFGVTGSGKTAVYLELARACLARGRSMLLLAPEVALALKLRRDVEQALPDAPLFFFHGYQTPRRRERVFRELAVRKEPCVVVGTRSALFLPVPELGAVVLDEEHDASFKQDEGLTYQAKELAWFRAAQANGLLVLGSATPDLKTFHAARERGVRCFALPGRVGGGLLPEVRLVPIGDTAESLLAPESQQAISETVRRGEQVVILLNRRGYAPLMVCLDCNKVARCPHCDIGLTYHKGRERLICHYCGHSVPFPAVCPSCRGLHYHPMGRGTERLEEDVAALLPPGGRVLRLDRDTTRCPGRMEAILEAFARQEAHVLVGTQMLSKGHHFPLVTLAVVADGDMGLNMPDYRAAERTFQLLVQSSGRAGRGEKPGQVLIQTRDTSHYCWKFVQGGDYEGFFEHEIALRRKRRYPPFTRLALIRMSFPVDFTDGAARINELSALLRTKGREHNLMVLGPAPAMLPLLRGRRRFQCLIKGDDWGAIRGLFAAVSAANTSSQLRLSLDIDPVNMM